MRHLTHDYVKPKVHKKLQRFYSIGATIRRPRESQSLPYVEYSFIGPIIFAFRIFCGLSGFVLVNQSIVHCGVVRNRVERFILSQKKLGFVW